MKLICITKWIYISPKDILIIKIVPSIIDNEYGIMIITSYDKFGVFCSSKEEAELKYKKLLKFVTARFVFNRIFKLGTK
jgi:hypothetical protein